MADPINRGEGHHLALADGRLARIVFTGRSHGDLATDQPDDVLDQRRAAIAPIPWTWLHQVHGSDVVVVDHPGDAAGATADAAVVSASGAPVAVHTADCAPVAVVARGGGVAVIHAGWRGLLDGVIERAVTQLRQVADGPCEALLGPCIQPECYEFSPFELAALERRFGPMVRARTAAGTPAFDLAAGVAVALGELGVPLTAGPGGCTSCGGHWFSHRARSQTERQALVAWIEAAA